jgi:hypothetical protein
MPRPRFRCDPGIRPGKSATARRMANKTTVM